MGSRFAICLNHLTFVICAVSNGWKPFVGSLFRESVAIDIDGSMTYDSTWSRPRGRVD